MAAINSINIFFFTKNIAVVGVYKSGTGFGYNAYMQLKSAGHNACPVNKTADNIEGNVCYNNLN